MVLDSGHDNKWSWLKSEKLVALQLSDALQSIKTPDWRPYGREPVTNVGVLMQQNMVFSVAFPILHFLAAAADKAGEIP